MKNGIIKIFVLSIIVWATACGKKQETPVNDKGAANEPDMVELTEEQYRTAGIKTGKLEQRQISGTIKVNGMLDVPPQQKVSISLPFGGFLKTTDLLQGMKINKGQVIAQIENPEFIQAQQDFLDTESQLEYAKAEYERQQTLSRENVNAAKTLQQAKSNYLSLQAKYNGLMARLEMMNINISNLRQGKFTSVANIYAPLSGYVTKVNVNIGMYLNPADVLFEIVDTRHLHAELVVFEKDISRIKIGQKVKFRLINEQTERLATVYLIGREIKADRTVNIHCHLDNEDVDLIPGTYLKAFIETSDSNVYALPDEAIVKFRGKNYVFIEPAGHSGSKNSYRFIMTEIETGNHSDGYTEVIVNDKELAGGAIVIKGAYDLLSKVMNSEE